MLKKREIRLTKENGLKEQLKGKCVEKSTLFNYRECAEKKIKKIKGGT